MTDPRAASLGAQPSTKVAEAAQFDSQGNHERALQLLAEAAEQGDVEAMTRLGKRLLTADYAPYLPDRGTELIVKGANSGGAEAAAQVAVLAAIGMHLPQSWPTAMAAIVFSAERGSLAAQGQLRVLAADRELAASRADADAVAAVGGDDRLEPLASQGAGRRNAERIPTRSAFSGVRHGGGVRVAHRAQPRAAGPRARLRRCGENGNGQLDADQHLGAVQHHARRSGERAGAGAHVREHRRCIPAVGAAVGLALRHRRAKHGAFRLHRSADAGITSEEVAAKGERIVTFLLYLNDDYDGGGTEFVTLGLAHKGRRGEGLFFVNALENGMPDRRTLHAGRPPTRGEKWVVSQFIRNRATF